MSEISVISGMFEELKQILKRVEKNIGKSDDKIMHEQENSISTSDLANIEDNVSNRVSQSEELILSKLEQIEQAQTAPKKLHHRISVDIKSSWVSFTLVGLFLFLVTSLCLCYKLKEANNRLADNDIKYRYIKMYSKTDSIQISQLEDIFVYNRNEKIIDKIKSDVQEYEEAIYKSAQLLEQSRLKNEEAQKFQNKADELKK
ncbi:MAG: hypothetical protein E6772_09810, partial [Dysgonomonas sp.]|nr:hypothetical protein [Dysgonomonas sp.]